MNVDFPFIDMANYCYSEACDGMLNKEQTHKLVEKCCQKGVTITSTVSSAIICSVSTLVNSDEDSPIALHFSITADTRRRCVPFVPNHDLSYQVSGIMPFTTLMKDIPKTSQGMWQLAKTFGQHIKTSIDAGQILAFGIVMGKICQTNVVSPNFAELPTYGISSWGVLPFREQYGQWKLIAMTPSLDMICAVIPVITIQTVNGILTITCVGTEPVIPLSVLESLHNDSMQKLHEMIEDRHTNASFFQIDLYVTFLTSMKYVKATSDSCKKKEMSRGVKTNRKGNRFSNIIALFESERDASRCAHTLKGSRNKPIMSSTNCDASITSST